jgi:hypothetical protein|tara:strand:- start:431 stop:2584 length:2154 start_codon:yes stop_codon:yes gene_type:complete
MVNQEVKGTLAKLLATENLTIEHRKVSTAFFDVEKRVLCLPIWKTASNIVYDLLVGHEVGHALYTPNESFGAAPKAFLNVLEDARIEKMMKQTYPGLRKSFFEGYRELWDMDFFGVKGEDQSILPLIDRINLYYKGNNTIPFSDEEMVWVERAANTNTFQDVIDLANELYAYAQEKQEEKESIAIPPVPNGEQQADDEQEVTPQEDDEQESFEDEHDDNSDSDTESGPSDDPADLDTPSYEVGGQEGGEQYDETESVTDAALQESLETLVDDNAKEWIYLNIPDPDLKDYVVPYQKVAEELNEHFYERQFENDDQKDYYFKNLEYAVDHYTKFKKDTQKTVNYLCKQFDMKKSADEYRRAAISKTGVIDTNSLHKYKLTEDIFKKTTVIPEGKNHGLVMHIDWSGSMQHQLLDTLKQTYNLIWFCKKSGIPFRVYGFVSGYQHDNSRNEEIEQELNELAIAEDFQLFEFFSSRQNAKSLEESMKLVYLQAFAMGGYRISYCYKYSLGGTPLSEAIYHTRRIVADMKKVENVTKVNVICLTDGEANPISFVQEIAEENRYYKNRTKRYTYLCHQRGKLFFLRDPKTGYTRRISSKPWKTTQEIVSFYREITDYNWVGIRICSKGDLTKLVREILPIDEVAKVDKQWKKERFASVKERAGFTEAFYMPDRGTGDSSHDLEVKQKSEVATKAELTRAFKKHMGSKMTNKTILNAFIEQIA